MRYLFRFIFLLVVMLALVACEETEPTPPLPTLIPSATPTVEPTATTTPSPTPRPTNTPQIIPQRQAETAADQSYLRVVHAIPDLATVNVLVEALLVAFDLGYGHSTEPTEISAGEYTVRVGTGGEAGGEPTTIIAQPLTVGRGETVVLLLSGTAETPILTAYAQDNTPLRAGESRVTLIHAIPRGPALVLRGSAGDLADAVTFSQNTGAIIVPAEPTTFALLDGNQVVLSHLVNLRETHNYTLIVTGRADNPATYTMIEFSNRTPGLATLRVINAAAEPVSLDFYENEGLFAANVEHTRAGARADVPSGLRKVEVYPAGADPALSPALTSVEFNVGPTEDVSLIAVGSVSDMQVITFTEDLSPVAPERVHIAFANTLGTARPVRVLEGENALPGVPDLRAYQVSDEIPLDSGEHNFQWRIVENDGYLGDTVEIANQVELAAGRSYLYLMTGRSGDAPPIIFSEVVGTDDTLVFVDESELPPTRPPTYLRLVNALFDQTRIDYVVDGITITSELEHGRITPPIVIPEGFHAVSARASGDGFDAVILDYDFMVANDYTIYTYGPDLYHAEIFAIWNPRVEPDNPAGYVRLVNVTPGENTVFDLGYAESGQEAYVPPVDWSTNPSLEGSSSSRVIPYREPLFATVSRIATDLRRGEASRATALLPGQIDFYIIDARLDMVAATIMEYPLVPGTQYDIVAYQELASAQVDVLLIPYSQP